VLLEIGTGSADDADSLYAAARDIDWREQLKPDHTFAVQFSESQSTFTHTQFAALKIKDAIVDQWRERSGDRPSVDVKNADLHIFAHVEHSQLSFYVDLAGESLHRRAYREIGVVAPLKETIAAAMLLRAGWPELANQGAPLIDPMCGSGTLLIEAAWMAMDVAPGLLRDHRGAVGWTGHNASLWQEQRDEAEVRRQQGSLNSVIVGSDVNAQAVQAAQHNLQRAGVDALVSVAQSDFAQARRLVVDQAATGLLISNPPYGERLGNRDQAMALYARLGTTLRTDFAGWRVALLTTDDDLAAQLGMRARRRLLLNNGALDCQLLEIDVLDHAQRALRQQRAEADKEALLAAARDGAFANRVRKNQRKLKAWLQTENVQCYRLYDADIPEYAVAVDVYQDWLHVQEYQPPKTVDDQAAEQRLAEIMTLLPELCAVPKERIALKKRVRQKGRQQYLKQAETGHFFEVREGPCRYWVNLFDYLDTGLFLDGRNVRRLLAERVVGRRFLNLFAYTATASVAAIVAGAKASTSVDISNTYTDWAQRNFALNGIAVGRRHRLERADCLEWLREEQGRYDVIYLDPPTFSNSKKMLRSFDVQRDHVELVEAAMARLSADGELVFVCNRRGFKLDTEALAAYHIDELTPKSIPPDFARSAPHKSFVIRAALAPASHA
jgi:23S rRNA (guanine2445-N2)-methyltransferase / 23S rRNA (guanine2069-N7)-methyltransferase